MLGWEGGGLSEGIGVGLKQEMGVRSVVRQVRRRPVDDDTSPPSSTSTRLDDPSDPWHLVRPPSPRPSPTALRADPTLCRPLSSVRPANRPADRRHLACRARARPRARPRLPARTALAGPLVRPLVPVRAPSQPPLALLHGRERADTARPPPPSIPGFGIARCAALARSGCLASRPTSTTTMTPTTRRRPARPTSTTTRRSRSSGLLLGRRCPCRCRASHRQGQGRRQGHCCSTSTTGLSRRPSSCPRGSSALTSRLLLAEPFKRSGRGSHELRPGAKEDGEPAQRPPA